MAVAFYELRINGGVYFNHIINVGNTTSFNLTGLSPETVYQIEGRAVDDSGNRSPWCPIQTTTTQAAGDRLLNLITSAPIIAVGLRKLNAFYNGACLRVRRASDNTELDIGFDGNEIDFSSILAFGSGTTLILSRWYDQSGSGRYLSENSFSYNPVVTLVSHKVIITFSGDTRLIDSETSVKTAPKMFFVCNPSRISENDYLVDLNLNTFKVSFTSNALSLYNGTGIDKTAVSTGLQQVTVLFQSGNDQAFVNGSELSGTGNAGDTATGSVSTTLGNYGSLGGYGLRGSIQEFILFDGDLIAGEQSLIEANQKSYYGL